MAYRRTSRRSGGARGGYGRRTTTARSGYRRSSARRNAGSARRRVTKRSAPQELRIVIEQTQGSPISRHLGLAQKINPLPRKAKY